MMPGNALSSQRVPGDFIGGRRLPVSAVTDYEDGGIAIGDPSRGSSYQVWRGRLIGQDVILDAPGVAPTVVYSAPGITEISFTFDQNMRPAVAFMQNGEAFLRWFDATQGGQVNFALPSNTITPRVTLDDKRSTQTNISDVIVAYVRNGFLCTRQQRDRFLIEYQHAPAPTGLVKIGMSTNLRLQFLVKAMR